MACAASPSSAIRPVASLGNGFASRKVSSTCSAVGAVAAINVGTAGCQSRRRASSQACRFPGSVGVEVVAPTVGPVLTRHVEYQ